MQNYINRILNGRKHLPVCYHRIVQYSYIFIHSLKGYRNVDKGTGKDTKMKIKLTV